MKDFRVMVWGHEREKKVSTGYEKGTDTGNGHIWRRFIVSWASHSNLIIATAQSWHGTVTFISLLASNRITTAASNHELER